MALQRNILKEIIFHFIFLSAFMITGFTSLAQQKDTRFGRYDTLAVPFIVYQGDTIPSRDLEMCYVAAPMSEQMKKRLREWTRLRNAVYVTYPYARKAGAVMNDMNAKMISMKEKDQRKTYIKSREKELKKEFTDPLTNLSIYQGKILMKLINRQTGNNCYEIIKEYKGGITARAYQTVAFFFNSSLKQPYDPKNDDEQIEQIVQEVERMYGSR
ncbi:MAG: DUF4294 domain-containing protein [Chitinophagaceae bacterium]